MKHDGSGGEMEKLAENENVERAEDKWGDPWGLRGSVDNGWEDA